MYRATGMGALPNWIQLQLPPVTISLPGGATIAALVPAPSAQPAQSAAPTWLITLGLVAAVVGVLGFTKLKKR